LVVKTLSFFSIIKIHASLVVKTPSFSSKIKIQASLVVNTPKLFQHNKNQKQYGGH